MGATLVEVMEPVGGFDQLIHRTIVSGEICWDDFKVSRANALLQHEQWYISGEFLPLMKDVGSGQYIDEYIYKLTEVRRVKDCQFMPVNFDSELGIALTGNLDQIGPAVLLDLEELCNVRGLTFCEYFDSKPNIIGQRNLEIILPKFQRR